MKKLLLPAAVVAGLAGITVALAATFATVSQPDGAYLSSTSRIDFSGLANYTTTTSVSDGVVEASFSTEMSKRQAGVAGGGWAYWGALPDVESTTPAVLYTLGADTLTITLNQPVETFGFELEPNWWDVYNFTVEFRSGGAPVGTITRPITGNQTALLFAASSDAGIDEVTITSDVPWGDFAIAQLRYALPGGPAPTSVPAEVELLVPGSGAISVNAKGGGVITVIVATTPAFDAQSIDVVSAVFGPGAAHEVHGRGHVEDADGDGDADLVLHFDSGAAGLVCGDTEALFSATTVDGTEVSATAPISMKGCSKK